jgi:hypothetical protein
MKDLRILVVPIVAVLLVAGASLRQSAPPETAADLAQRTAREAEAKATEDRRRRLSALTEQIELYCERNAREKLLFPESASFDPASARHDPSTERDRWTYSARFTYRSAIAAGMPGAIRCEVDTSAGMIRLVDLKVGRP